MTPPSSAVAGAVIAGGAARRLGGVSKSALVVGGRSIAARQVELLRAAFARVLVVTKDPAPWAGLDIEVTADRHRDAGPLAGIHAALAATAGHTGVVCVAGDMPFIEPALLALVRDHAPEAAAVVPRVGGHAEPLLARYAGCCLEVIEMRLAAGARAVHEVFDAVQTVWLEEAALRAVDPLLRSFTNVNTAHDLAALARADTGAERAGAPEEADRDPRP